MAVLLSDAVVVISFSRVNQESPNRRKNFMDPTAVVKQSATSSIFQDPCSLVARFSKLIPATFSSSRPATMSPALGYSDFPHAPRSQSEDRSCCLEPVFGGRKLRIVTL
jgi:hypothetical protein